MSAWIPGPYVYTAARDFNGSSQYLQSATGLGLTSNAAKTFGGWFRVDSFSAQRVLMSIGVVGAGTSRIFLSTAITTGVLTCTTTDAGVGSSSATTGAVTVGTYFFAFGVAYEGNTGRAAGLGNTTRGTEGTTRATTVVPNCVTIGATPSGSALLDGACLTAWVVSREITEAEQAVLSYGAHIVDVVGESCLGYWTPTEMGFLANGMGNGVMVPIGAGGSAAIVAGPTVPIQSPPQIRRAARRRPPAATGNPWYAYAQMRA